MPKQTAKVPDPPPTNAPGGSDRLVPLGAHLLFPMLPPAVGAALATAVLPHVTAQAGLAPGRWAGAAAVAGEQMRDIYDLISCVTIDRTISAAAGGHAVMVSWPRCPSACLLLLASPPLPPRRCAGARTHLLPTPALAVGQAAFNRTASEFGQGSIKGRVWAWTWDGYTCSQ